MRKTLFAGLTVLDPDESIMTDNGAFTGRDRDTEDRFLEIGAKTHRHTGLPGLSDPVTPVIASIQPSGGTLSPSTTFTIAYTLEDSDNGETTTSDTTVVTTQDPLAFPTYTPTAVIDYSAGSLLVDTYYYTLTFIDANGGETPAGPSVDVERQPGYPHGEVLLTGLNAGVAGASAAGWRLYRAVGGGTFDYLASGTASSYIDNGSVSVNCDIHPPADNQVNTTNSIGTLRVVLPSAISPSASFINLYGSLSGDFIGNTLLGTYPSASAGQTVFFTSYAPEAQSPPDVNLSIGGASKIDPDTELLDWHWKRPVATIGDLPIVGAASGDVRIVLADNKAYEFNGAHWSLLSGGGGSGGTIWEVLGPKPVSNPYLVWDPFTDSYLPGRYTFTSVTDGPATVLSEHLTHSNFGVTSEMFRTAENNLEDQTITMKLHTGSTPGSFLVMAKSRVTTDRYFLAARVRSGFTLDIGKVVNGSYGTIATGPAVTLSANTDYWLQLSVLGNVVTASIFTQKPTSGVSPLYTKQTTLAGADATNFGVGAVGSPGVQMFSLAASQAAAQTEYIDDFLVTAYGRYTDDPGSRDISVIPDYLIFRASGDAQVGVTASGASAIVTIWASAGGGGGGSGATGATGATGAAGQDAPQVKLTDSNTTIQPARAIDFTASGEAGVDLVDLGGGSARVNIFAPSAARVQVDDNDTTVYPIDRIHFQASGQAGVDVSDGGNGDAIVTIHADAPQIKVSDGSHNVQPTREIDFFGATVADLGGGSASVTITGGGGGGASVEVKDADVTSVNPISSVQFLGSGGIGADVIALGGGSARVSIGRTPLSVYDADPTVVVPTDRIRFVASGSASVDVTDLGGGSAQVMIHASASPGPQGPAGPTGPQGPAGGGGGGGTSYARASASPPLVDDSMFTEYRASGGLSVGVGSLGTGSASVTVARLGRSWTSAAIVLASGASGSLDFFPSAAGARLLKLQTSSRARVRAYGDATHRTADLARAMGTDPQGDHGVLLDYAATLQASGMLGELSPAVDIHNLDTVTANTFYLNITNYDATGTVTVAFLMLPTEIV